MYILYVIEIAQHTAQPSKAEKPSLSSQAAKPSHTLTLPTLPLSTFKYLVPTFLPKVIHS